MQPSLHPLGNSMLCYLRLVWVGTHPHQFGRCVWGRGRGGAGGIPTISHDMATLRQPGRSDWLAFAPSLGCVISSMVHVAIVVMVLSRHIERNHGRGELYVAGTRNVAYSPDAITPGVPRGRFVLSCARCISDAHAANTSLRALNCFEYCLLQRYTWRRVMKSAVALGNSNNPCSADTRERVEGREGERSAHVCMLYS